MLMASILSLSPGTPGIKTQIPLIISFIFSVVIYALVDREINRFSGMQRIRIERQLSPPPTIMNNWDKDLVEESKKRLLTNLLVINGAILVISG